MRNVKRRQEVVMRNPFQRRPRTDTFGLPGPHLETAEATVARMEREQAEYVSKHWTRR